MLQLARQAQGTALRSPFLCKYSINSARLLPTTPTAAAVAAAIATPGPVRRHNFSTTSSALAKKKKSEDDETKSEEEASKPAAKDAKPKPKKQAAKPKKERKVRVRKVVSKKEPAPRAAKPAPLRTEADREATKIQLWKETLDVLKDLKEIHAAPVTAEVAAQEKDTQPAANLPLTPTPENRHVLLEQVLQSMKRVLAQEAGEGGPPRRPRRQDEDGEHEDYNPKPFKAQGGKTATFTVDTINPTDLELTPVVKPQPPVPGLAYGLDRVLFNPGVYQLQDPRSKVYNFDPYLSKIMPVDEFDFNAIKAYITSSKDTTLISAAAEHQKKYTGSTSSMSATLAHFHYLLSNWRPINTGMLSKDFETESTKFTQIMRAPSATFLHWKDGTYAIDADKEFDTANILSMLGKSMEKFLTLPKAEFEKYRKRNSDQLTDEEKFGPEAYHYTTMGDFMMRSQLDAYDPRVCGTGMFDLKTRAVISIRMDAQDFHKGLGYEIRGRQGDWQSFEREYFDMIRSAFLKYSLQVRMGRMDGIFVAFHNTQRIFGFQYIPLEEMDLTLHGTSNTTLGHQEFKASVHLLNKALDKVTAKFPGQTLRIHFETRPGDPPFMYIFAKPVTPEEIEKIQGAARDRIEEFEREMMGIERKPEAAAEAEQEDTDEAAEVIAEEDGYEVIREDEQAIAEEDGHEVAAEEDGHGVVEEDGHEAAEEDGHEVVEEDEHEVAEEDEHGIVEEDDMEAVEEDEMDMDEEHDHEEVGEDTFVESRRPVETNLDVWEDVMAKVEKELENEEHGSTLVREAVQNALRQSGLLETGSPDEIDRYVDALSEALTSESNSQTEITADEVETLASDQESEALAEESASTSTDLTGEAQQTSHEEGHADAAEQIAAANGSSSEDLTLKDLILRLASQVQSAPNDKSVKAEPAEPVDEAAVARLGKFEQILSELIDKTRDLRHKTARDAEASDAEGRTLTDSLTTLADDPLLAESSELTDIPEESTDNVYGLILTVRNKVNGNYVARPENLQPKDSWDIEYAMEEIEGKRAETIYKMLLNRRQKVLSQEHKHQDAWYQMFSGQLEKQTNAGRSFREKEDRAAMTRPVHVYGHQTPYTWQSVFGPKSLNGSEPYRPWLPSASLKEKNKDNTDRSAWLAEVEQAAKRAGFFRPKKIKDLAAKKGSKSKKEKKATPKAGKKTAEKEVTEKKSKKNSPPPAPKAKEEVPNLSESEKTISERAKRRIREAISITIEEKSPEKKDE
ncbi:putative mitochondrial membrane protein pet127 protein [Podospora australis]|uniref:Mitochondrial membrane protein pet127 protein n=1 Tax=Podospora australis TaxID=1536484 RepID=A0AAN7ALP8_9PEZI|nr:putative mitochondrial membrane protein pet127 protein [Podospora australis]